MYHTSSIMMRSWILVNGARYDSGLNREHFNVATGVSEALCKLFATFVCSFQPFLACQIAMVMFSAARFPEVGCRIYIADICVEKYPAASSSSAFAMLQSYHRSSLRLPHRNR